MFNVVVELEKFRLGIHADPSALVVAIPRDGPGDVAHQEFIRLHPTGDLLDFGWIIWRIGQG